MARKRKEDTPPPGSPAWMSIIAKPILVDNSIMIFPANGAKLTIPNILGVLNALVNSEKVTVSELATPI